jgi:hypothetical protein
MDKPAIGRPMASEATVSAEGQESGPLLRRVLSSLSRLADSPFALILLGRAD